MKRIYKNIIALLLLVTITSCNSFLDVTPTELTQETFYKSEGELKSALIGVYAPLNFETFYGGAYPLYLSGGDDLSFYQRANPGNPPTSILLANANTSTPEIATFWKTLYEGINRANLLLENVDRNKEISQAYRDGIRAEALFMRSFFYFNLVQAWGDVPLVLQPFKKIDNTIFKKRDSKQLVYDQLIADIEKALPNIPEHKGGSSTVGTITRTAAMGVLSRIYLFRAGEFFRDGTLTEGEDTKRYYQEAKRWALEVKNSGKHGLAEDYAQVFIDLASDKYNSQGVVESMWEAEFYGNREGEIQAAGRAGNTFGFGSRIDYSQVDGIKDNTGMRNPGYSYRFIYGSLKLVNMYDNEKDDVRGNWNIAPFEYTYAEDAKGNKNGAVVGRTYYPGKKPADLDQVEGMPCVELEDFTAKGYPDLKGKTRCAAKFRREYERVVPKSKNFTPINFPILRYSDVLLMLAEAENYLNGPTELAYECINAVRSRAKIKPLKGLDKASFLDAIKKERAMELAFEATRRWDLVRWGNFLTYMRDMKNYVRSSDWNQDHKYAEAYYNVTPAYNYFPIPDLEIGANPMKQNPGW